MYEEMLDKIANKAMKCGCKCVIIANIVSENEWKIQRTERNDITIVKIPSLLIGDVSPKVNEKAFRAIRRCINDFSD